MLRPEIAVAIADGLEDGRLVVSVARVVDQTPQRVRNWLNRGRLAAVLKAKGQTMLAVSAKSTGKVGR